MGLVGPKKCEIGGGTVVGTRRATVLGGAVIVGRQLVGAPGRCEGARSIAGRSCGNGPGGARFVAGQGGEIALYCFGRRGTALGGIGCEKGSGSGAGLAARLVLGQAQNKGNKSKEWIKAEIAANARPLCREKQPASSQPHGYYLMLG